MFWQISDLCPKNNHAYNLGSSTEHFRKVTQSHINNHLIHPLLTNGWNIINVDIKPLNGVGIVADICSENFIKSLSPASLAICTNMLEHVNDIPLVVRNLFGITEKGGYILLTVPYKYKRHLDPIDNMFRPTPNEIANLFPEEKIEVI